MRFISTTIVPDVTSGRTELSRLNVLRRREFIPTLVGIRASAFGIGPAHPSLLYREWWVDILLFNLDKTEITIRIYKLTGV